MRVVVLQRTRCRSTNKTVPHPEQPFVVKLRPTLRDAFCRPATQLLVSLPRVAHRIAMPSLSVYE